MTYQDNNSPLLKRRRKFRDLIRPKKTDIINQAIIKTGHSPASNYIRSQINQVYKKQEQNSQPNYTSNVCLNRKQDLLMDPQKANSPSEINDEKQIYSHDKPENQRNNLTPEQSKELSKYHTAWQEYYQKYYANFYMNQVEHAKNEFNSRYLEAEKEKLNLENQLKDFENNPKISEDEELYNLRQKLLGKVQKQATKVKKSRHFIPLMSGIFVMLFVAFLQYNSILLGFVQAYIAPGNVNPQNIVVDPTKDISVSPDPLLIIPNINVNVPVIYNVGIDEKSQLAAMVNGVAQFKIPGANALPGQNGNLVLSGHSSNDLFDKGNYKFIFAKLDKLTKGNTIYINYQGKRYTYSVTGTKVVTPDDVNSLRLGNDKPMLTLITCTPLGTSEKRLLVYAEQINPDPKVAKKADDTPSSFEKEKDSNMPGIGQTILQKLFHF